MENHEVAQYWEENAATWTRHVRSGHDVYRDALNTPAFLSMLPPVAGLTGLDIGCGEGANTRQIARLGARMHGVDIAPTFILHAEEAQAEDPLGITYRVGDATRLPFEDGAFDFATAFMCLMDVPDQAATFREARRVIRPGGFLQFSILHPCFAPPSRKVLRDAEGRTLGVEVAGYFDRIDGRIDTWWFSTVSAEERETVAPFQTPRFHRTLSEWVAMICAAGLVIDAFVEPCASEALAAAQPVVADTRVAPMSLLVRARRPA